MSEIRITIKAQMPSTEGRATDATVALSVPRGHYEACKERPFGEATQHLFETIGRQLVRGLMSIEGAARTITYDSCESLTHRMAREGKLPE